MRPYTRIAITGLDAAAPRPARAGGVRPGGRHAVELIAAELTRTSGVTAAVRRLLART